MTQHFPCAPKTCSTRTRVFGRRVLTACLAAGRGCLRAFIFHPDTLPLDWQQKMENAETEPQKARVVADHIAGMTDRFAIDEHRRLFDMNVQV